MNYLYPHVCATIQINIDRAKKLFEEIQEVRKQPDSPQREHQLMWLKIRLNAEY